MEADQEPEMRRGAEGRHQWATPVAIGLQMYGEGDPVLVRLPHMGGGEVDEASRQLGHLAARSPTGTLTAVTPHDLADLPVGSWVYRMGVHIGTIAVDAQGQKLMRSRSEDSN